MAPRPRGNNGIRTFRSGRTVVAISYRDTSTFHVQGALYLARFFVADEVDHSVIHPEGSHEFDAPSAHSAAVGALNWWGHRFLHEDDVEWGSGGIPVVREITHGSKFSQEGFLDGLGAWQRNSRKARKKARKEREKDPTRARGYYAPRSGYYDRRVGTYAGTKERGELRDAMHAFSEYLHAHFSDVPGITRFVSARYHLVYTKHIPNFATDGERWGFLIVPKGGRHYIGQGTRFTPSDSTHGDVVKVYAPPAGALPRVRQNVALAYRGMSYEDFETSMRRGWFASLGAGNIPGQGEAVTFFSKHPDTASMYARDFQAWPFHATFTRPGVIIAVPRSELEDYLGVGLTAEQKATVRAMQKRNPHVNEMIRWGKLPFQTIRAAWYVMPLRHEAGYVEARKVVAPVERDHTQPSGYRWEARWGEGQRHSPSGRDYVFVPVPEFDTGLGGLSRRVRRWR